MNLKKRVRVIISLSIMIAVSVSFLSCEKDKDKDPKEEKGPFFVEITKKKYPQMAYYSFTEKKQLEENPVNWDIAFSNLSGRTNGGLSGTGKCQVYAVNTKDFDKLVSAEPFIKQVDKWEKDKEFNVIDFDGGMPPPSIKDNFNKLLINGGWYKMEMQTMPPTFKIAEKVYIIRNAKGDKYVKLQFLDVRNSDGVLGNIKFKWDYISDKGENDIVINEEPEEIVLREGEVLIKEVESVEKQLKTLEYGTLKYLIVQKAKVTQADLNFMKSKMKNLEELNLADATLEIGKFANGFKDNKSIKKLTLPKNITLIGFGQLAYTNILEFIFPGNSLKEIGEGAFAFAKAESIVLPESLETIHPQAFMYCTALKSIVIPEKVMIVPKDCFSYSKKLAKVVIKGKVRNIGSKAFYGCSALGSLRFMHAFPPTIAANSFQGINVGTEEKPKAAFEVPKGSVDKFIEKWGWNKAEKIYFTEF